MEERGFRLRINVLENLGALTPVPLHVKNSVSEEQRKQEQDQEEHQQESRDRGETAGRPAETERAEDKRENGENDSVIEHDISDYIVSSGVASSQQCILSRRLE